MSYRGILNSGDIIPTTAKFVKTENGTNQFSTRRRGRSPSSPCRPDSELSLNWLRESGVYNLAARLVGEIVPYELHAVVTGTTPNAYDFT